MFMNDDKFIPKKIRDRILWRTTKFDSNILTVKKILHDAIPCEECGIIVTDRREALTVSCSVNHHPHIKTKCLSCGLYKNPVTGVFDMDFYHANIHYLKKKKDK